jgi:hypothetical protein
MKALRRALAIFLVVIAGAFPTMSFAWFGEDLWNGAKETAGGILDFGEGVLEVGWEGIYGAGCGVKNLATWDGNACTTSVSESGDKFRSLISDVDDCAATFDPTGLAGLGTGETVGGVQDNSLGISDGEVGNAIDFATSDEYAAYGYAKAAATPAVTAYLSSRGAQTALMRNPVWQRVGRGLPLIKYAVIAASIAQYCGSTLDFLITGVDFLVNGQEIWRERDGIWLHCTTTCVPDPDLNRPGCEQVWIGGTDDMPAEMICRPGTGDREPDPDWTPDRALKQLVCGQVLTSSGSNFDYDAYCDGKLRDAAAACRAGTSTYPASTCSQLTGSTPTNPDGGGGGESGGGGSGGGRAPTSVAIDPRSVPGGSVEGSCAQMIRDIAARGTLTPYATSAVSACVGTTDTGCHLIRARAAAGQAVFPMSPDLQRRCFG